MRIDIPLCQAAYHSSGVRSNNSWHYVHLFIINGFNVVYEIFDTRKSIITELRFQYKGKLHCLFNACKYNNNSPMTFSFIDERIQIKCKSIESFIEEINIALMKNKIQFINFQEWKDVFSTHVSLTLEKHIWRY